MDNNTWVIRLNGKSIDEKNVSCLGKQLKIILEVVMDYLKDNEWYISDVSDNENIASIIFECNINEIRKIDDTNTLLSKINLIDQFYSGVFIAVRKEKNEQVYFHEVPETETEEGLQYQDAEVEIRAFDTSYFEIYTKDEALKKKICSVFNVKEEYLS